VFAGVFGQLAAAERALSLFSDFLPEKSRKQLKKPLYREYASKNSRKHFDFRKTRDFF
jgi:hypothetical protein